MHYIEHADCFNLALALLCTQNAEKKRYKFRTSQPLNHALVTFQYFALLKGEAPNQVCSHESSLEKPKTEKPLNAALFLAKSSVTAIFDLRACYAKITKLYQTFLNNFDLKKSSQCFCHKKWPEQDSRPI